MNKNILIVSNWKMNLNLKESLSLIETLKKQVDTKRTNLTHVICPQFLLIPEVSKLIENTNLILGAQDCHYQLNGSFTGDSSITILKDFSCKYVILGHSERRSYYNETNLTVKKKSKICRENGIQPIICVGESFKLRKDGSYMNFILNQIEECIEPNLDEVIVAYEPIWAIGTGETPLNKEINEVKEKINLFLKNSKNVKSAKFLYGGSVDSNNFNEIIIGSDSDGALVGGASVKEEEITKIITNADFN